MDRLKCDRARPCDNCVKRREADTCVYPVNGSATRDQTRESKKTKKRIERLESLVMELLDRNASTHEAVSEGPPTTSETDSHAHYHLPHQHSENGRETDNNSGQREVPPVRRVSNLAASSSSHSLWETVLQDVSLHLLINSGIQILTENRLERLNCTLKSMKLSLKSNSERSRMRGILQQNLIYLKAVPVSGISIHSPTICHHVQ